MTIQIKEQYQLNFPVVVDLTGPDGDPYVLITLVRTWGNHLGLSKGDILEIVNDMMSKDVNHLLYVIENHFGDYVTLLINDPRGLM